MTTLEPDPNKFRRQVRRLVDQCRVSAGMRLGQAREVGEWMSVSTGEEGPAIFNKIPPHIDKLASSVFCPVDPRFDIEYENTYSARELRMAEIGARWLTREFSRRDLDLLFGQGVDMALRYGSAIVKLAWGHDGLTARLVDPWCFGVYVETNDDIDTQEALCETSYITAEEFWRRIMHRSDARQLYQRATRHAQRNTSQGQLLPTGLINVLPPSAIGGVGETTTATGGGVVNVSNATTRAAMISPEIAASLLEVHELFVVNDETQDYTTIQMVEPDIIVAPRLYRKNLFIPFAHPYINIVINPAQNYFWGRSEAADLIPIQRLMSARLVDIKKIMSLQYRRIRAFIGFTGMNDEMYDQLTETGWVAQETGTGKVDDLTPPVPPEWRAEVEMFENLFNEESGMTGALTGAGVPGIRSEGHFQGAVRMASPRLRDRSLRAERQYAAMGDKALWLAAAKDAHAHWLEPADLAGMTDFALSSLPGDARVVVDSHSSSPIYEQDHAQLVAFGLRAKMIGPKDALRLLPFPNRDQLADELMRREKAEQALLQQLPPQERALALLGIAPGQKKRKQ